MVIRELNHPEVRWRNAIWRNDFALAQQLAAQLPEIDHSRAVYTAVTAALLDPERWPHAETEIALRERDTSDIDWLRLQERPLNATALSSLFESGVHKFDIETMLMWAPEFSSFRKTRVFQNVLQRLHIPEYWAEAGWPPQCRQEKQEIPCD